jgi:hypothetical protein
MKQEIESQISDLKGDVDENLKVFLMTCPSKVENKASYDLAENKLQMEKLAEFKMNCQDLRKREKEMINGLEIFDINPENYKALE